MKKVLICLVAVLMIFGCKDKAELDRIDLYSEVNTWLHQNMTLYYYWNKTLPVFKGSSVNPMEYFPTLKNSEDRFSVIFEDYQTIANQLNGISAGEVGFEFNLYLESAANSNVIGIITYVKKGIATNLNGLTRGSIFRKINGQQITTTNYKVLLGELSNGTSSVSITPAINSSNGFIDQAAILINKTPNYHENPVYLDSVYTVGSKKVGYLVYNFFTNDDGDKSMKYDLKLNDVMGNFKAQNISELIVDFRYNSGGSIVSAIHLGSMLVPNLIADKVYNYTEYNNNFTDYFNSSAYKNTNSDNPFVDNFALSIDVTSPTISQVPIQNLGDKLQRVYFITSDRTASASEMVINGLKPYIPCVLVGDTTVGKNVGSILINDEENVKNKYAFMPIILKYFNKDKKSDFTHGFAPDLLVNDDYSNQLGNINEAMLKRVMDHITGAKLSVRKAPALYNHVYMSSLTNKPLHSTLVVNSKAIESCINNYNK